jgi:putative ABC transport system permease protein
VPDLRQELFHAARTLARRVGFTTVATGTIALAIAANTAIFSIVDGVLLRPLPFEHPERLAILDARAHTGFTVSLSIPNYRDWRDRNRVFESFGASAPWGFVLTGRGPAHVISARAVLGNFFTVLGVRPLLGRLPAADEVADHDGTAAVAVLGHAFWKEHLAGDSGVVGRALTLSDRPYTVIGVLPPDVGFPDRDIAVYVPMGAVPGLPWDMRHSGFGARAIARLKPGLDFAATQRDLDRVGREVRETAGPTTELPEVQPLTTYYVGNVRTQLWLLMGAAGFILLIVIANIGNLLLARGEERQTELAVRAAIGASRATLVRLLLAEAMVLALAGGTCGGVLAYAAVRAIVPLLPAGLPAALVPRIRVDGTVLMFAVALAAVTGIVLGLIPELRSTSTNLVGALKSGSRTTDSGGARIRPALVVAEVTLALIMLVGAGLMLRSLSQLGTVDKGFDATSVLTASVAPNERRYPDKARWLAFYDELRARAAALPGVRVAALAMLLPLSDRAWELRVYPEGVPLDPATGQSVLYNVVSPEYFRALNVPVLRGRAFTSADRDGVPLVAIVDETMAQRFWPGTDPIGKRLTIEEQDTAGAPVYRTIVGVTRNVRHYELESPSRIQVYVPVDQTYRRSGLSLRLVLKADVPPPQLAPAVRALVAAMDSDAPVSAMLPLDSFVDHALAPSRAMTRVLATFGAAALALAALGIFGVMSYEVTRRRREIGIRMALGASSLDVMRWTGLRALRPTLLGVALGLCGAGALTRLLHKMLFEVSPLDPLVYGSTAAGLAGIALLAAYLPARRASRVDPATVLNDAG